MVVHGLAFNAEWIDLTKQIPNSIRPPRSGHVAFTGEDSVYVFGGYAEEEDASRYPTNDLWKWDNTVSTWEKQPNDENAPQPRLAAAAAASLNNQQQAYVFGGWDSQQAGTGGVILNDIVQYSLGGWKTVGDLGLPTSRLVAVAISPDTILLHNHRCVDHVLLFQQGEIILERKPVTGEAPSPRGLHAAVVLGNSKLVVFGGAAQEGTMSNEVFVLDLNAWTWTKRIITSEESPTPRASPCFCAVDDNHCILFGGADRSQEGGLQGCNDVWLLNLGDDDDDTTATWELLSPPNPPPGRNAATLTKLPAAPSCLVANVDATDDDQYFLLSGGWYPFQTTYSDTFVLKVSSK